jgi:hypothetical protein
MDWGWLADKYGWAKEPQNMRNYYKSVGKLTMFFSAISQDNLILD